MSVSGLAQAAGNGVWNCEQTKNGEWNCLNQDSTTNEPASPQVIKTPVGNPTPVETAKQPVVQPQPQPQTVQVQPPVSQSATQQAPAENVIAQPVPPQAPVSTETAPTIAAKPAIGEESTDFAEQTVVQPHPPKPKVHITENRNPRLKQVEPVQEKVISAALPPPQQKPGWTCQAGNGQPNWNCNLVGPEPQGEAQVVANNQIDTFRLLTPSFSHSQELTFQTLRGEFKQDPWQNCENWAMKKPRLKTVPQEVRDNAITDVHADFSEAFEGEVMSFSGNVDLTRADQHLLAEKANYDSGAGTMDAQGNVIYSESTLAFASDTVAMNLNTDEATLRRALFISGDGPLRGSADTIYRDSKDLSRYNDASFTSCAPGNQDWIMHASRLKINQDSGQGSAKDAWMEFKGVPVIYTPYISFPTDNRRLSGFLAPNWGQTTRSGFYVAAPYYWNIAPNLDTTITPRYFSGRGGMLSNQFRYLTDISKGSFGAEYMPNDQKLGKPRYSLSIKDKSFYSPNWNSLVDLNLVSDKTYFNDLNNALGFTRNSFLPSSAYLNYGQSGFGFSAGIQHYQSVDPAILSTSLPYDLLPRVNMNYLHNFEGMPLRVGLESQYSDFYHPTLVNGQRLMVQPSISMPLELTAGFFIPKLSVQSTQYQLSRQSVAGLPSSINRTLPIFSVDSGLSIEKGVDFGATPYNNIIEPRFFYLYIPRKDQSAIPIFDSSAFDPNFNSLFRENSYSGYDRLQDANQVTLAATSRYIDSVTGLEPLKASFGEIFYFQDRTVTLTSTNQPLLVPVSVQTSKTSNFVGDVSGQISQYLSYATGAQWNAENNRFARGQVGLKYRNQPGQIFDIGYRYRSATANPLVAPTLVPGTTNVLADISLADVSFRWPLFDQWYALGRWQYSLNFDKTLESFIGFEKENCCWRFRVIARRYINGASTSSVITQNLTPETAFFVQLELKGLSGLGDDVDTFLQTALNGYRPVGFY